MYAGATGDVSQRLTGVLLTTREEGWLNLTENQGGEAQEDQATCLRSHGE